MESARAIHARILGNKFTFGYEDYRAYRENDYVYVDKTHFMKTFIESEELVSFVSRPKPSGKTLTLSMLHHFLSHQSKETAFKGLFDDTLISEDKTFCETHQHQYLVCRIDMKDAGKLDYLKHNIARLILQHISSDELSMLKEMGDKGCELHGLLHPFIDRSMRELLRLDHYRLALKYLLQALHLLHVSTKKVKGIIALIDNLDFPFINMIENSLEKPAPDSALEVVLSFLSCLDYDNGLYKAVAMSTLRIHPKHLDGKLRHLAFYDITSPRYAACTLFTQMELNLLFEKASLTDAQKDKIIRYTGGYYLSMDALQTAYLPYYVMRAITDFYNRETFYWRASNVSQIILNQLLTNPSLFEPFCILLNAQILCYRSSDKDSSQLLINLLIDGAYVRVEKLGEARDITLANELVRQTCRSILKDFLCKYSIHVYKAKPLILNAPNFAAFNEYIANIIDQVAHWIDIKRKQPFILCLLIVLKQLEFEADTQLIDVDQAKLMLIYNKEKMAVTLLFAIASSEHLPTLLGKREIGLCKARGFSEALPLTLLSKCKSQELAMDTDIVSLPLAGITQHYMLAVTIGPHSVHMTAQQRNISYSSSGKPRLERPIDIIDSIAP